MARKKTMTKKTASKAGPRKDAEPSADIMDGILGGILGESQEPKKRTRGWTRSTAAVDDQAFAEDPVPELQLTEPKDAPVDEQPPEPDAPPSVEDPVIIPPTELEVESQEPQVSEPVVPVLEPEEVWAPETQLQDPPEDCQAVIHAHNPAIKGYRVPRPDKARYAIPGR